MAAVVALPIELLSCGFHSSFPNAKAGASGQKPQSFVIVSVAPEVFWRYS
jgi:hypothetical protein